MNISTASTVLAGPGSRLGDQPRSDKFQVALANWFAARADLDGWAGDDDNTGYLCSKTASAVDALLAVPAPNIAGVLAKLDSMWCNGGQWSNDLVHRAQIIADLRSFTVRASDVR